MGECLDIISGIGSFYPATSVTRPPPTTKTGSCEYYQHKLVSTCTPHQGVVVTYLTVNPKFRHGIDNAEKGGDGFSLLPNLGLVQLECEAVMLKVRLNLLAVYVEHIQIGNGQDSPPMFIAVGKLRIGLVKNTIKKGEVIRDLFISLHVKAVLGFHDGSVHIRHYGLCASWMGTGKVKIHRVESRSGT